MKKKSLLSIEKTYNRMRNNYRNAYKTIILKNNDFKSFLDEKYKDVLKLQIYFRKKSIKL